MTTQKEYRANLVEALRSGNYTQGQLKLRTHTDKFCCLGVACDLVDPDDWDRTDFEYIYDDDSTTSMSFNVRESYGFRTSTGGFKWSTVPDDLIERLNKDLQFGIAGKEITPDSHCTLARLNDVGVSFDLIADLIESEANLFYS